MTGWDVGYMQCSKTNLWNIFLCVHRVGKDFSIKIADFGLARDVYSNEYYRKKSAGKIPIRWMAPEALNDRISNQKTDVVRFN